MDVSLILNIFVLAVLFFIGIELYLINKKISKGISLWESKDEYRKKQQTGQTINVNVTPGNSPNSATIAPIDVVTDEESVNDTEIKLPTEIDEKEEISPVEKESYINTMSSQSGSFSVKCKHCQTENSRYRRECFTCGKAI